MLVALVPKLTTAETRQFVFEYTAQVGPAEEGGALDVFVPLATSDTHQRVLEESITASIPGEISQESAYGNRYWHGRLDAASEHRVDVTVRTVVERRVSRVASPAQSRPLTAEERDAFAAFLAPNRRVPVNAPILEPIRAEVRARAGSDDPAAIARAIYDWVVDNVEYKKVGTGWGNGDTYWACNERRGNCTDFHALFISLARSEGIPARFEIGFPVPESRSAGEIAGYHCWVQFYLPEVGWFPIDASEAFKHPDRRDFFYGAPPGDRIHMTTGRD
ncbi:transglutaminase-like domain-containing protein, partial [Myxococcota bacterium]|nr:transglutaminase-like domain-containing protein [Myxococcota bacterium]